MKSKPTFEVDIIRGGQTLSFTCSFLQGAPSEGEYSKFNRHSFTFSFSNCFFCNSRWCIRYWRSDCFLWWMGRQELCRCRWCFRRGKYLLIKRTIKSKLIYFIRFVSSICMTCWWICWKRKASAMSLSRSWAASVPTMSMHRTLVCWSLCLSSPLIRPSKHLYATVHNTGADYYREILV